MILPPTSGYNYVNKLTGEIYVAGTDIPDEYVPNWVECLETNISKWQDYCTWFNKTNGDYLSGDENGSLENIAKDIYNYRDTYGIKELNDSITGDDIIDVCPSSIASNDGSDNEPDEEPDEEPDDKDDKYTFDDLMADAGVTDYQQYMELKLYVETLTYTEEDEDGNEKIDYYTLDKYIETVQDEYNKYAGLSTGTPTGEETHNTWDGSIENGDNEDSFVIETKKNEYNT